MWHCCGVMCALVNASEGCFAVLDHCGSILPNTITTGSPSPCCARQSCEENRCRCVNRQSIHLVGASSTLVCLFVVIIPGFSHTMSVFGVVYSQAAVTPQGQLHSAVGVTSPVKTTPTGQTKRSPDGTTGVNNTKSPSGFTGRINRGSFYSE